MEDKSQSKYTMYIEVSGDDAIVLETMASNMDLPVEGFLKEHVHMPMASVLLRMIENFRENNELIAKSRKAVTQFNLPQTKPALALVDAKERG